MSRSDRTAVLAFLLAILVASFIVWAGSQGATSALGAPIFSMVVGLAFLMQWLAFIPAYLRQTERLFDVAGSITYIAVAGIAVWLSPPPDGRSLLLLSLVVVWAIRLGTFLFRRIRKVGKDGRFDEIKPSFVRFLSTWTLQGLWVTLTLGAALAAITASAHKDLGVFAVLGAVVWASGLAIETMADLQKNRFRACAENTGRFIRTGLWAWSRHPNYFGEIALWTGIAVIALPVLEGWQWTTIISPIFVTLLLTRVSGIPMLEKRANEKWGGEDAYESYKRRTAILIPRPPRRDKIQPPIS